MKKYLAMILIEAENWEDADEALTNLLSCNETGKEMIVLGDLVIHLDIEGESNE